jgi:hypothetical protein
MRTTSLGCEGMYRECHTKVYASIHVSTERNKFTEVTKGTQKYKVRYKFSGYNDGEYPDSSLLDYDKSLWRVLHRCLYVTRALGLTLFMAGLH